MFPVTEWPVTECLLYYIMSKSQITVHKLSKLKNISREFEIFSIFSSPLTRFKWPSIIWWVDVCYSFRLWFGILTLCSTSLPYESFNITTVSYQRAALLTVTTKSWWRRHFLLGDGCRQRRRYFQYWMTRSRYWRDISDEQAVIDEI